MDETITLDFTTHNPDTGQVQDADGLPSCEVFEDDTDAPMITPAVVKRAGKVGDYRVTFVASDANGFEAGKSYNVIITAAVNFITAKARISSFALGSFAPPHFKI